MRKSMLVVVATGTLLVGCSGGSEQSGASPATTAAETPMPSAAASKSDGSKPPTISPEESKAINNDTQYYESQKKVEIGALVPLHCQTKKTWADIAYPGGEAAASGYKISRSTYPRDEDVVLGMFTDLNKTGCTFSYLVALKRVSPQGPALLARPDRQHWNVETPQVDLSEGGFASYHVRIDYGKTTYLLFKANGDTTASKSVMLTGYTGGAYTAIKQSPEKLLK